LCQTMISRIGLHRHQARGDAKSCTFSISPPVEGIRRVKLLGTAYLTFAIPGTACLIFKVRWGVPGIHPLSSVSDGLIPRQPGYAVEVLIGTGELGQSIRLHHRHNQGIVAEEPHLPAKHRPRRNQWGRNRQHLDAALQDSLNRLVEARELLREGGMLSEPPSDPLHRSREGANCFDRHDPVSLFGQDVRGGKAPDS